MPRLLLINPWIADVAAYDLWAWPLGLLRWAAWLRARGCDVRLVDCTDRAHPAVRDAGPRGRRFGTGKYWSEPWPEQPAAALRSGRVFRRFGLPPEAFEAELDAAERVWGAPPDAILVTSRMTYWYPGVADAIVRCRRRWPDAHRTPVVLGGVYATLCTGHAREHSGADLVIEGDARETLPEWFAERGVDLQVRAHAESGAVLRPVRGSLSGNEGLRGPTDPVTHCGEQDSSTDPVAVARETANRARAGGPRHSCPDWPAPAFDLCHGHEALPIALSEGCPFDCSYCASRRLAPAYHRLSPDAVFAQVRAWHERWGTRDFAFYDDALLVGSAGGLAAEKVGQASCLSRPGDDAASGRQAGCLSYFPTHPLRPPLDAGTSASDATLGGGPAVTGSGMAGAGCGADRFFDLAADSGLGLRFHAPNGLHYGPIDAPLAGRLRRGGLETVRLSLESASPERLAAWGRAGDNAAFRRAVGALREAGYSRRQVGVYILVGLPGQTPGEVRRAIELARDAGAMPKLNEYSPIPGTREWPRAVALSGPEIEREPLWQNNSLYRTRPEAFPLFEFEELRSLAIAAGEAAD